MTELKREYVRGNRNGTSTASWVVDGPGGAIELETVSGLFAGVFVVDLTGERVDAIKNSIGREVFAARLTSDAAVYDRLEALYRKEFPGGGRCGESVPQANYATEDAS